MYGVLCGDASWTAYSSYMFRFNHHHQGAYYLSFDKVIVIKIIS